MCVCARVWICFKRHHLRNTPLLSPGDKESLLNLRKRRWPPAPSPRAPHPRQVSPLPRLPPGQSPQPARNPSPEVSCCDLRLAIPTAQNRGQWPQPSEVSAPDAPGQDGVPQALDSGSEPHLGKLPLPSPLSQGVEPPGGWVRIRVTQLESGVQRVGSWGLSCR